MKPKPNPFHYYACVIASAIGLGAAADDARAATFTWNGGSSPASLLWSDTGNWGGSAPADSFNDAFVFAGTNNVGTSSSPLNNDRTGGTATSITFNSGAGAFFLGGNAITLGGNIVDNATNTQTIAFAVDLASTNRTITVAADGRLELSGAWSRTGPPGSGSALSMNGAGTTAWTGNWSDTDISMAVSGGGALEFNSASGGITGRRMTVGSGTVSVVAGAHSFTAVTNLLGDAASITTNYNQSGGSMTMGTLQFGKGTVNMNLSGSSLLNVGTFQFGDATTQNTVTDIVTIGTGSGSTAELRATTKFDWGNSAASTGRNNTVEVNGGLFSTVATSATNTASNAVLNIGNGGTLQARAASTTFLAGLDTFNIKDGGAKIDTQANDITIANNILNFSGATTDSLTKVGNGALTLSGANTYSGGTYINVGTVSLGASSTPSSGTVTSGPLGTGSVYLGGGTLKTNGFTLANNIVAVVSTSSIIDSTGNATLNGNLSGSGTITKSSANQLVLGGNNASFQGTFTETGTGPLSFLSGDSGSAAAKWVQGAASTWVASANGITVKLGELSSTVSTGTVRPGSAVSAGNQVTFEVGALGTDATYSGKITDYVSSGTRTANVTKVGSGNWTLSNTHTYTGETRVTDGTLTLGHATNTLADTSAVNVNGGELALGTNTDTVGAVTLTSGSITGNGAGRLTGTGSNFDVRSGTISAKLGGSVGLDKTTGGTVTISSDNSSGGYTGNTTVTAGTLVVNGNISTSTLATVSGTGKLAGSGTVGALTIENGGTLAPGTSPGTISVIGNLGLKNSSILDFELNPLDTTTGSNINDLVAITGGLTLDGLLRVTATSGNFLAATNGTKWTLFTYSGSLANNTLSFDTGFMPQLGSGLDWSIDTATTGQVNLVVIPEPRTAMLGLIGTFGLLCRRRP